MHTLTIFPASAKSTTAHLKSVVSALTRDPARCSTGFTRDTFEASNYTILPEEDYTTTGTVWSFPRIRQLPRYSIDPVQDVSALQWAENVAEEEEDDLLCNKDESRGYAHKKHTAGLFVGCCLHAVVYGFHMMVQPEGRKDLMKVLFERFPKEVLDQLCVVFDFNCQAAEYMLN